MIANAIYRIYRKRRRKSKIDRCKTINNFLTGIAQGFSDHSLHLTITVGSRSIFIRIPELDGSSTSHTFFSSHLTKLKFQSERVEQGSKTE